VRYYTQLKAQPECQRRITWINNAPSGFITSAALTLAFVEYLGSFQGALRQPHGSSKSADAPDYVRASKKLAGHITGKIHCKPMQAYQELTAMQPEDVTDIPRNKQQVKTKQKYKKRKRGDITSHGNLSDQILNVLEMSGKFGDFLRSVNVTVTADNLVPSLVLFTQDQIEDIKAFCFSGRTVLEVDRTFNLGELYVTATVYKHLGTLRRETGDHPIHVGPMFHVCAWGCKLCHVSSFFFNCTSSIARSTHKKTHSRF
jgi:hypothetical protein